MTKSDLPILSIITPVGRMAGKLDRLKEFLQEAVKLEVEVHVIHDHIDEETCDEIQELMQDISSKSIRFHDMKSGGPGAARNLGLSHATGKWVTFADSDDLMNVNRILKVIESLTNDDYDVIISQFEFVSSSNRKTKSSMITSENFTIIANQLGIWRWLIKAERANAVRFPEIYMGEDQVYVSRLLPHLEKIGISREITYSYFNDQPGQLTSSSKFNYQLIDVMREILIDLPDSSKKVGELRIKMISRQFISYTKDLRRLEFRKLFPIAIGILKNWFLVKSINTKTTLIVEDL